MIIIMITIIILTMVGEESEKVGVELIIMIVIVKLDWFISSTDCER